MYENSQSWANTLVKVCSTREQAFDFAMETLFENLSFDEENDNIYHLLSTKDDAETEDISITINDWWDHIQLEYDVWWFRLTLWDETHACRFDLVTDDLSIELS